MIEWLSMGGYGFYVWGSYGMLALTIGVELVLLKRHRARARTSVRQTMEETWS